MKRRKILKSLLFMGGASACAGLYAWQLEPFWLEIVKLNMPIKNLPDKLVGKTIMQISDLHAGGAFDMNHLSDSLNEAKEYKPDYVVYTGDFVNSGGNKEFDLLKKILANSVRGKIATIGVLGNHDYGHGWSNDFVARGVTQIAEGAGIKILRNEKMDFHGLNIIGIDDFWGTNYNPTSITSQINFNEANLVLCHNPDVADQPIWNGYKGWVLSGHTHGGQCKPPFLPPPILPVKNKKYTAGLFELENGISLYINRALGHLWQIRFNVRPEITLFTLEKEPR